MHSTEGLLLPTLPSNLEDMTLQSEGRDDTVMKQEPIAVDGQYLVGGGHRLTRS